MIIKSCFDFFRDGYLDFEEFKDMILRARARKELKTLEEDDLDGQEMELLELEQKMQAKNLYKASSEDHEGVNDRFGEEIEEDLVEEVPIVINEIPLEDNIPEDIMEFEEDSAKVGI